MKTSVVILYVLVSLSLVFSLTALIIVAGNNFFTPSGPSDTQTYTTTPQPTSTNTITPTPTPTSTTALNEVTFNYSVSSQNKDIFIVSLEYQGESNITINYSQFLLASIRWKNDLYSV